MNATKDSRGHEPRTETYYVGTAHGKAYFNVTEQGDITAVATGRRCYMPPERFADFINTAKLLGLDAGRLNVKS